MVTCECCTCHKMKSKPFWNACTGCTVVTRITICKGCYFRRFHCASKGRCETKLFVSTGSAGSTQTNLFNNFRSFTGRQLGEVFLAEIFFFFFWNITKRSFHVSKFNALSTLLTASLNLDPNRQEDNTSEIQEIKPNEKRNSETNANENNGTCGSLAAVPCFSRTRWGVTLTQPSHLLPSWKNTYVVPLQILRVIH